MRTLKAEMHNPFHRPNPYYVPQRYYSQEKSAHYSYSPFSPYQSVVREESSFIGSGINSRQISYKTPNLNGSRLEMNQKQGNVLRRKNINCLENPFYRKHLLPTNAESSLNEENHHHPEIQQRISKEFLGRRMENNFVNMPSLKSIPSQQTEKENKVQPEPKKYLSSQLKIKLRSQAQLYPPTPTLLSCGMSKQAFVTLGRLQNSNQRFPSIQNRSFPTTIQFRGKTYHFHSLE